MKCAQVALGLPRDEVFDYLIPANYSNNCSAGCRVLVPFLKRTLVGYVADISSKTKISRVKPLTKLIDQEPILDTTVRLFLS